MMPASGKAFTTFSREESNCVSAPPRERRRGRQRDEVRHVARERVGEPHRLVAVAHADVDVLPEHRELLGEVAVELARRGWKRGVS